MYQAKNLAAILATSTSMAVKLEAQILQQVFCIWYPVLIQKDQAETWVAINSQSEVNAMTLPYAAKLGFITQKTSIKAQKIDGSIMETYDMALASF